MSLVEVLVSSGIMVVGLLSLAALIPVGLFQAAQASRADSASAVGRAAWRTIKVADMLRDRRTDGFGQYWCVNPVNGDVQANCVEPMPFYPMPNDMTTLSNLISSSRCVPYAGAYVIDPFGLSSLPVSATAGPAGMGVFPSVHANPDEAAEVFTNGPWLPRLSLMSRMPANMTVNRQALTGEVARRLVLGTDDPTYDYLPVATDYARPVRGMTATSGSLDNNSSMHFDGNYSWMVTVSPIFREPNPTYATDNLSGSFTGIAGGAIPQVNREFTVSVVVFHKRTPPVSSQVFPRSEECRASVTADSDPYGRHVTLMWANATSLDTVPKLRAKDWVMLYGYVRPNGGYVNNVHRMSFDQGLYLPTQAVTTVNSVNIPPTRLLVAKWCQVQAADTATLMTGGASQVLSLKSSDFETVQGTNGTGSAVALPLGSFNEVDGIFAATMPNVAGVFEKTIRLE